ncbi:MAG TPA: sugar ABC transporter ATP-binding protein [Bdellovibrionota bacterium]|nr:sugar ABC transporter ATP-binding protein [Bdellovibrionota bacterium]
MFTEKNEVILKLQDISKSFGRVCVLSSISLEAFCGEIVALVGENGAGKSTLMKILSGVWPAGSYEGEFFTHSKLCVFVNPSQAENAGISIIHQELNLIPELSIAENIFLTKLPQKTWQVDFEKLYEKTQSLLNKFNLKLSPKTLVKYLSIGHKQIVEIMKALAVNAQILILDEPTSALTQKEIVFLYKILRQLRKEGVLCFYISHKLEEIFELCDRLYVLRDGKLVYHSAIPETSPTQVISAMVGRPLQRLYPHRTSSQGAKILEICDLTARDKKGKSILNHMSLSLHKGEILGIAGLMGAGRSEFILTLFGASDFNITGEVKIDNRVIKIHSPREAIEVGLALVTEDRKLSGIIPDRTVSENMTLSSLRQLSRKKIIKHDQEESLVQKFIGQFKIKTHTTQTRMRTLSGGNQQKVLLARSLLTKPKVLLLDEPTRGVDVGAKAEIYELIHQLSREGVAIIIVSSELPEVLNISDRIAVFNAGELACILSREEASEEKIMFYATESRKPMEKVA